MRLLRLLVIGIVALNLSAASDKPKVKESKESTITVKKEKAKKLSTKERIAQLEVQVAILNKQLDDALSAINYHVNILYSRTEDLRTWIEQGKTKPEAETPESKPTPRIPKPEPIPLG